MQPYRGGSITVWGGVCPTARTDLHACFSQMDTVYVTDILEQYIVPTFCPIYRE
jgi:hypothetical protein